MNRADLFDATANLGAELLAQIFLRDRAGSNAHRGLARTRSAATAVIANAVLLHVGVIGVVRSEYLLDLLVVVAALIGIAYHQRDRCAGDRKSTRLNSSH